MSASQGQLARLRQVARIIGPQSASAKALAEYDRRTASGESVGIFEYRRSLIVGPATPTDQVKDAKGGGA